MTDSPLRRRFSNRSSRAHCQLFEAWRQIGIFDRPTPLRFESLERRQMLSAGSLDLTFGGEYGKVLTSIRSLTDIAKAIAVQADGKIVVAGLSDDGDKHDIAVVRYNADGSLDGGFGGDGKVVTPVGNFTAQAYDIAVQPDGKILVAGISDNGGNYDFALVRYDADGSLDTSFDGDGKVVTPIGGATDRANSVALQPDGKIVVAGESSNAIAVVRYNGNGSLDTDFDVDGKVVTQVGNLSAAQSVALQADGKIVVGGYSITAGNDDFVVVRYNADGSLDTAFDVDGKVVTPVGSSYDIVNSIVVQLDGKVVVAGYSNNGSNSDFAVVRYNADGSLDGSFDVDGEALTPIGSSGTFSTGVAVQPDGKIVVAGTAGNGANRDFAVVRYNADGTLDTTFDGDGKATTPIGSPDDYAYSVALQADGKIVVAGSGFNGSNSDFAVVRFNANGSLDTTFDGDGRVLTPIGSSQDYAFSVAVQSDGRIVVAGTRQDGGDAEFAVVRYNSDGSLDNSFDEDGKALTSAGGANSAASKVVIQADGRILVAGRSYNGGYNDFALVVYHSDGSLDTSFDTDGQVVTSVSSYGSGASSVATQADGKIVVAGTSEGPPGRMALVRFNSDGSLDESFGEGGKSTDKVGQSSSANAVAIQPNGKIVVAGFIQKGSKYGFGVARFESVDANIAPLADAGGPYSISEGDPLALDASGSYDPDGSITSYSWDVNGDSVYGDATGVTPALTWEQLQTLGINAGPAAFDVRVQVTDSRGDATTSAPTLLTIINAAPRLGSDAVVMWGSASLHPVYTVPTGDGEQLRTVPVARVDTISITFPEDVNVALGDLTMTGVNFGPYTFTGFSYDSMTFTATWTLPAPMDADELTLVLSDDVTDLFGAALDGEWDNPTDLLDTSSSTVAGNGIAGGDFEFHFTILPGDANRDNKVTGADYTIWADNYGTPDAAFEQGDFTGDGRLTPADYTLWADNFGLEFWDAASVTSGSHTSMGDPMPLSILSRRQAQASGGLDETALAPAAGDPARCPYSSVRIAPSVPQMEYASTAREYSARLEEQYFAQDEALSSLVLDLHNSSWERRTVMRHWNRSLDQFRRQK